MPCHQTTLHWSKILKVYWTVVIETINERVGVTGDEVAPGHRHQDEEEVEDEAGEPDVSLVRLPLPVQAPQTQDSHQQTSHHQSITY